MSKPVGLTASINVAFALVCKDASGEVLKTIQVNGALTPDQLGLTQEQAHELAKEPHDHDRQ